MFFVDFLFVEESAVAVESIPLLALLPVREEFCMDCAVVVSVAVEDVSLDGVIAEDAVPSVGAVVLLSVCVCAEEAELSADGVSEGAV